MRNALAATLGAIATLALICAACGVPRLYGTGCAHRPLGFALARYESDMPHCRTIAALPWVTE